MTTGHAPDDWLDIPPPPFAPGGDGRANGESVAESNGDGDGELPTGELQVVDVPDAEEMQGAAEAAGVGDAPAGELPAVGPDTAGSAGPVEATSDAGAAGGASDAAGDGVTMTGQFRAVAAVLAADVAATRAAQLAGSGTGGEGDGPAPAAPPTESREELPAGEATEELPVVDGGDPAVEEGRGPVAPEPGGVVGAGSGDDVGDVGEELSETGELPVVDAVGAVAEAEGEGGVTMTGQFRAVAAALAADVAATRSAQPAGDAGQAPAAGAEGATGEGGDAGARDGELAPPGGVGDDRAAGGSAEAVAPAGGAEANGAGVTGGSTGGGVEVEAEAEGAGRGGSAGRTGDVQPGGEGAAAGAPADGEEGQGGEGAPPAAGGSDEVDVAGAVEVPEPPPAPKAWRVPVLRSKRDPAQPVPPDAVPKPAASAVTGTEAETETEAAGGPGPRALRRIEARRHRTVKLRRQRRVAVGGLALLVAGGASLGMVGLAKVRGSTGGNYVDPQIRPDEPGYVALVTPTPTLLVVHKDAAGDLSGVSLLSLHAQDVGGSVIVMPVTTVAPFADAGTTFADAYADLGAEGVTTQVELTLNITIGETVEVDDRRWATLADPVAPITLDLDRAVGEWPAGEAQIPADQVGAFLNARTDSETELRRLDRQELFWEAWLPLVKAGGRNAVPGEVDVGLGRFVRGLAAGDTDVAGLPVSAAFALEEMYSPTEEMLPDLVAQAIPYPQEPSRGSRVQTQLLNGTTQRDLTARAATSLVAGGAEIALVGNAASFAEPTTRFVYATSKLRDDAENLRDAFGVGEVVQAPPDDDAPPVDEDRIDVTVILGADALDALGG